MSIAFSSFSFTFYVIDVIICKRKGKWIQFKIPTHFFSFFSVVGIPNRPHFPFPIFHFPEQCEKGMKFYMNKEIIILNSTSTQITKNNLNKLIAEINKLDIGKFMKKILLIACINLLSTTKTTKGLIYQLETFKKQGKVFPDKTRK